MIALLLLPLACAPTVIQDTIVTPVAPEDTGISGGTTVVDTGEGDSGGTTPTDSGAEEDPVEEVPEAEEPPPGLCHVVVDCGATIPDEPKISCEMSVVNSRGATEWDGPIGIELRGRSSQYAEKHQYSVELRDDAGEDQSANLLGMGAESDWVLNGAYFDRALVRNALAFDLFRDMGEARRAPDFRYCDLELDGEWQGIYLLTEKVERDDDRIDLAEDDGAGSSFLLKLDDTNYMRANVLGYGGWRPIYPDPATPGQQAGINSWMSGYEQAALYNQASLGDWFDLDNAVDLILLEEFMKNNDAFYLSLFLWRDQGGLLNFTPWDLDLSLGQPSYNDNENPNSWIAYRPSMVAGFGEIDGWDARMEARWAELRAGPFATDAVLARIDLYQATMGDAIAHNFEVWPIETIDFWGYLYPISSYEAEDAYVREWIVKRLDWMDGHVGTWSEGN